MASGGFIASAAMPGLPEDLEPEAFRQLIYASAASQRVRWWKAFIDPTYDMRSGAADVSAGKQKWMLVEQDVSQYRVIVQEGRAARRMMPEGTMESGDITVMSMPDEIALGDHDQLALMGRELAGTNLATGARTIQMKEPVVRGQYEVSMAGTVSSSGTTVTGIGTSFTTLTVGSIIRAGQRTAKVTGISSNTSLTIDSPPIAAWNNNVFVSLVDRFVYYPVYRIEDVRDATKAYTSGVDYKLGADGMTLEWISANSPSAGSTYSVIYRFYPVYQVMGDLGLYNHTVDGVPLPQIVPLRLMKPDSMQE